MPSTSARASEMKSSGFSPYCRPGLRTASPTPSAALSTADDSRVERLKPLSASTQMVMAKAPAMSRIALTICTQVVPFIPPTRT